MVRRREFLRAGGAVAGTALLGTTGAAAAERSYRLVSEAVNPVSRSLQLQDDIAYTSNRQGMVTIDFSTPTRPEPLAAVPAAGNTNNDVKVSGDVAGAANDGSPGGVTFFDVSDPAAPVRKGFYDAGDGIHNHDLVDGYAYICVNDSEEASFSEARVEIVDVSDPADPTLVGQWKLEDHYTDYAHAGTNVAHDVKVENGLAYVPFWDAGAVVLDVSDPANPVATAHFGALEDAGIAPRSTTEFYSRYIGAPGNAHYAQPYDADGDGAPEFVFVGAETYPDPTGTAIPEQHGGVRIFDVRGKNLTKPISTETQNGKPVDPTESADAVIAAPETPRYGALRCSHNFDFDPSRGEFYCSWYQGGIRAYDVSDPLNPSEISSFLSPDGNAFWAAANLPDPTGQDRNFTLGAERDGKGIVVLELTEGGESRYGTPTPAAVRANRPAMSEVLPGSVAEAAVVTAARRPTGDALDPR